MELEFDKEIDALLRKARDSERVGKTDGAHLDADAMLIAAAVISRVCNSESAVPLSNRSSCCCSLSSRPKMAFAVRRSKNSFCSSFMP